MYDPTNFSEISKWQEQLRSVFSPESNAMRSIVEANNLKSVERRMLETQDALTVWAREHECLFPQSWVAPWKNLPDYNSALKQLTSELNRAAEFARASTLETFLEIEQFKIPKFDFPAFPKFSFPELPNIDWTAVTRHQRKAAIHLAERGWTICSWMSMADLPKLKESSDTEIDDYFVKSYLGTDGQEGELRGVSTDLLVSVTLGRWKSLLEEVFDCLNNGKYKVCVPPLVTILEGLLAESFFNRLSISRNKTKVRKPLEDAKWHEGDDFDAVLWTSVIVFVNHLFADSDFESPNPTFINRHWILHGRSDTNWTVVDALKLLNAIATLHWLVTDY